MSVTKVIAESFVDSTSAILDIVYPPVCGSCRKVEAPGAGVVCEECWGRVMALADVASRAQEELEEKSDSPAGHVGEEIIPVAALGEYNGPLGEMIQLFKFGGHTNLGIRLGVLLADTVAPAIELWRPDMLIPAPLHSLSRKKRGFNQAEILSDILAEGLSIPSRADLLIKSRRTRSQSLLSFEERQRNLLNAFSAHPVELKDKRVALVDDVITTGATIIELCRTLADAGATVVGAVALASAKPEIVPAHPERE